MDDGEVTTNPNDIPDDVPPYIRGIKSAYGIAIEDEVARLYNLFDREDNVLQQIYPYYEGDIALGQYGNEPGISAPSPAFKERRHNYSFPRYMKRFFC